MLYVFLPHSPPLYYFIDGLGSLVKYIVESALRHSAHHPASFMPYNQSWSAERRLSSNHEPVRWICMPGAHLSSLVAARGSMPSEPPRINNHTTLSSGFILFWDKYVT